MTRLIIALTAIAALIVLFASLPSYAWDESTDVQITEQDLGDFTYSDGTVSGKRYRSTKQRLGDFEYEDGSIGDERFSCTSQRLGDFVYRDCN